MTLIVSTFHCSHAQTSSFRLKTADSLFAAGRFTQSLTHYEQILAQQQYSPAMLLRMAYVHEGLQQLGPAMYYLNLYYLATADKTVLDKMGELATRHNLEGYETTDSDRFRAFYLDHHLDISVALAALAVLALSATWYTRMRARTRPTASAIAVMLVLALLAVHQQYPSYLDRGILSAPTTYLMNGPSAGASVIGIAGDGHRVEVMGSKDVWTKIRWQGDIAWVRQHNLRPVKL